MPLFARIYFSALAAPLTLIGGRFCAVHAEEAAGAIGANAATPTDRVERIRRLIAALGSDSYPEREWAARDLFDLGRAAIEPLEYAAKSEDSEVRLRATQLLFSMRGRGFMGINLQEEQLAHNNAPLPDDDGEDSLHAAPYAPPVVKVMGIANAKDYNLSKPFPAEVAGLTMADKILEINNRPINGVRDLMREVITIGPARLAVALIDRDGKKIRVPLMLTRNPMIHDNPAIDLERELEPQTATLNPLERPAQSVKAPQPIPDPAPAGDLKPAVTAKDNATPAKENNTPDKKEESPAKK